MSLGADQNSVEVLSDSSVLVTSFELNKVWRLTINGAGTLATTGDELSFTSPDNVYGSPDSKAGFVLGRGGNRVVTSFRIPGLTAVDTRSLPGDGVCGVMHPSGNKIYVRTDNGEVVSYSFNSTTGALGSLPLFSITVAICDGFFGIDQMAITPDGSRLYVSEGNLLNVYDANTGDPLNTISDPNFSNLTGVCFASSAINPGALDHFTMTGYPSAATPGTNFGSNDIVVTACDASGNIKTDYTGQVYFTSTDGQAVLPYTLGNAYTFTSGTAQDNGVHIFAGADFTLNTVGTGSQTLTVTDGTTSVTGSINVNPAPASISIDPTTLNQSYGFTGPVTATTVPSGLSYSVTYAGSDAEPTNAGSYAVVATITDPMYTPATDSKTLVIAPASLTITANDEIKIWGTTFTFDGTTQFTSGGLMNSDTVTSVTLASAGALSSAPVGTCPIVPSAAVGAGLSNYATTYVNGAMTVFPPANGKSPIVTLWSHPNPSVYAQPVTFTAAVFGGFKNIPTGKVTFKNGTAVLGTGTLDKFGLTSIKTSALPVGKDSITAVYSGDSIYASGTSIRAVMQLVQYDTTVTLSSTPNPSSLNGAVLFAAQGQCDITRYGSSDRWHCNLL